MSREQRQYQLLRWSVAVTATIGLLMFVWVSLAQARYTLPSLLPQISDCGCQTSTVPMSPFGTGVFVGVATLTAVMLGRGGWRFGRRLQADRQLQRVVRLQGRRIQHQSTGCPYWLVPDTAARAMTIGLIRPQVVVTTGLVQSLTKSEFASVLRHEQNHQRAADPLWSAVLDSLNAAWFWFPGNARWLQAAFRLRELAADQAAMRTETDRTNLGNAVIKLALSEPGPVPAFSPNRDRVEKLLNPNWRPRLSLWRWTTLLSLGLVITGLVLLGRWTTATAATVQPVDAGSCQEIITACRLSRSATTSGTILCVNEGGWRCVWVAGPRMSTDDPFPRD